jgi:hypothetical protein
MSRPGIFRPPPPRNEPVKDYAPGSPERAELQARLAEMTAERLEIPCVIGGEEVRTGDTFEAVMPHEKDHVLADVHQAGAAEVERAIAASAAVGGASRRLSPRGGAALRPLALDPRRRHDAEPVEDRTSGGDRRRL